MEETKVCATCGITVPTEGELTAHNAEMHPEAADAAAEATPVADVAEVEMPEAPVADAPAAPEAQA